MITVCAVPLLLISISSSSEQSIYFVMSLGGLPLHSSAYLCSMRWFCHYGAHQNIAKELEADVPLLDISGRKSMLPLPNTATAQCCLSKTLGTTIWILELCSRHLVTLLVSFFLKEFIIACSPKLGNSGIPVSFTKMLELRDLNTFSKIGFKCV